MTGAETADGESFAFASLRKQLLALDSARYEFGVLEEKGRMARRMWSLRQALGAFGWLQARNVNGAHVYCRPAGTDYVLVDDVARMALLEMGADGLAAAAVVETSPQNYQVWLKFERELGRDLSTCVGQILATRYGGDPGSVDFRHLGRAAGFTNRKKAYRREDGRYPWVRLKSSSGVLTGGARELRLAAELRLKRKIAAREEAESVRRGELDPGMARAARAVHGGKGALAARRTARGIYETEFGRLERRYGSSLDASRADAAAARRMAFEGYSEREIAAVLEADSGVRGRKPGHAADYAARTAKWAWSRTAPKWG